MSVVPSIISHVMVRVATVDLAALDEPERARSTRQLATRLATTGVGVAILGAIAAPVVPALLGTRWEDTVPVLVVLFLSVPWRLLLTLIGVLALVHGHARELCRFELGRLVLLACAITVGAVGGVVWAAAGATLALVAAAASGYLISRLRPVEPPWRPVIALGALTGAVTVVVAAAAG
jgi:O-antigen/teichoic acid export membrane protein